jgi:hypothetical protein
MPKQEPSFFADREIRTIVIAIARGQIPDGDLQDFYQTVLTAAVSWTAKKPPKTLDEAKAVTRTLARNLLIKLTKRRRTDRKYNAGVTPDADEHGKRGNPASLEEIDAKAATAEFLRMIEAGELPADALEMMDALAAGTKKKDYAREKNIPYDQVLKRSGMIALVFGNRLRAMGMSELGIAALSNGIRFAAGAAVIAGMLFLMLRRGPEPVVHQPKPDDQLVDAGVVAPPRPEPPPPQVLVTEAQQKAIDTSNALLKDAQEAAKKKQWKRCVDDIRKAWSTDAGDRAAITDLAGICNDEYDRSFNSKAPPH